MERFNHEATRHIIESMADLADNARLCVKTDNRDWQGNPSHSDYITIEQEHHIGVEVFGSETRVDYFDDHQHFGPNYSFDDQADYLQETIDFLRNLLTGSLVKVETFRGRTRIRYEWFFRNTEGQLQSAAGPWLAPLLTFCNPFRKKETVTSTWQYHRETGRFIQVSDHTVSIHKLDWDLMVEIRRIGNGYTFYLEQYIDAEDEDVVYSYWSPVSIPGTSIYDTEEKALAAAKEAAMRYRNTHKHTMI